MTLPLGDMLFHMYLSDRVDWQTCHQFAEHELIVPRQRMGPLAHGHKNKKWKQMGLLKLDAPVFHYHAFHSRSSFHYVPRFRSSQTVSMNYDVVEYRGYVLTISAKLADRYSHVYSADGEVMGSMTITLILVNL